MKQLGKINVWNWTLSDPNPNKKQVEKFKSVKKDKSYTMNITI